MVESSSLSPRRFEGRSALARSVGRNYSFVFLNLKKTDKALVSNRGARSVQPCISVHVSRSDKGRPRNLLGVQPKPSRSRAILPSGDRSLGRLRFEVVIETREILIGIILPDRKGRDSPILLRLGPVKNLLIFACGRHCNCDLGF